jgi:O-acetyl-ADP-ribose deacetylase (regulator of RNase III)
MSFKYINGDLVDLAKLGHFDIIVHGCNCFCTMGAGIAATIRTEFPEAWRVDQMTINGDYNKLGTINAATITRYNLIVINAYTQYKTYGKPVLVEYDAVRSCMWHMKQQYGNQQKRFGLPLIGAGLAGGDWNIIKNIIKEELAGENVTIVQYVIKAFNKRGI